MLCPLLGYLHHEVAQNACASDTAEVCEAERTSLKTGSL
jgi:hypothetical protein